MESPRLSRNDPFRLPVDISITSPPIQEWPGGKSKKGFLIEPYLLPPSDISTNPSDISTKPQIPIRVPKIYRTDISITQESMTMPSDPKNLKKESLLSKEEREQLGRTMKHQTTETQEPIMHMPSKAFEDKVWETAFTAAIAATCSPAVSFDGRERALRHVVKNALYLADTAAEEACKYLIEKDARLKAKAEEQKKKTEDTLAALKGDS